MTACVVEHRSQVSLKSLLFITRFIIKWFIMIFILIQLVTDQLEFKVQALNFDWIHIPRLANYLIKLGTKYFRVEGQTS